MQEWVSSTFLPHFNNMSLPVTLIWPFACMFTMWWTCDLRGWMDVWRRTNALNAKMVTYSHKIIKSFFNYWIIPSWSDMWSKNMHVIYMPEISLTLSQFWKYKYLISYCGRNHMYTYLKMFSAKQRHKRKATYFLETWFLKLLLSISRKVKVFHTNLILLQPYRGRMRHQNRYWHGGEKYF